MPGQPRIIVVARGVPVEGSCTVSQLDPYNMWLGYWEYMFWDPVRYTLRRVSVEVDEGPERSLEGLTAQLVVDKFMEALNSYASKRGVLAYSAPVLAATVLAAAAESNVNPARVTLRIDLEESSSDEQVVKFLIERLKDAVNIALVYVLWGGSGNVGLEYLDELIQAMEAAASRPPSELERLAVKLVAWELWTRASQLRDYMKEVLRYPGSSIGDITYLLKTAAYNAQDPDVKQLATSLLEATEAYYLILGNLEAYTWYLKETDDPAQAADLLRKTRNVITGHLKTFTEALDNADKALKTLENKSITLTDEEEIKRQLLEA